MRTQRVIASLAALVLWGLVMRSKKSAVAGKTAEELARWRRVRRRHPLIASRARQLADLTGLPFPEAFARAWERTHGAAPGEPTIGEIRTGRRAGSPRCTGRAPPRRPDRARRPPRRWPWREPWPRMGLVAKLESECRSDDERDQLLGFATGLLA